MFPLVFNCRFTLHRHASIDDIASICREDFPAGDNSPSSGALLLLALSNFSSIILADG
jgi:hypothetical protein